ncbi:odorant receptor 4-like [Harmonia axyridis]|uniref:odorant receptor 4-like n=1 Tax=Harmonia axyridis TaxID=115357 RepID=UPI001E279A5F|nr:odorant receptor 4-like [Harmonia axyridis]
MTSSENDMYQFLLNDILLLEYSGLWATEEYSKNDAYHIYSIFVLIFLIFLDVLCMVLRLQNVSVDLETSSPYFTILAIKLMGCVKLIMFKKNKGLVCAVIKSLNSNSFRGKTKRERKMTETSFYSHKIAFRTFFTGCYISCSLFVILPLLMAEGKILPFDAWYPYSYEYTPWYIITYVHQVLATFIMTNCHIGIDTFSAGLMTAVSCQCEILVDRMMSLDEKTTDFDGFFRRNAQHHGEILILAKRLNKLFSFYAFAQMSLCVLLFCTAMFRLSVVEPGGPEFFTVLLFISAISVQLFLYCWFGNEVTVQSSKLHLAAFHCDWIGSPISFQKKLIFFMRKSIEPIKIYALHFFPLSIMSFSMIMKHSWSYFAVLQQMHNRESMCTLTVTMFLMSPILLNQRKMPFEQWYPYSYESSPWFEITYLHQIIGTFLNSCTNVGVDTFSVGLMVVLGSQCELLEDKFLNFHELVEKNNLPIEGASGDENLNYDEIFCKLVQHHQQILLFSKRLNKMFNYYTFIQIALCILLFCTAMYRLSIVNFDNFDFLPILAFIGTISVQLFLYCWFGNEVNHKSSKLHLAAYKSDWVGSPISFQKKLCVFMRRTKEPIQIYALSFFPLNTVTFTSVMRSSWSIFLLLRQVNE